MINEIKRGRLFAASLLAGAASASLLGVANAQTTSPPATGQPQEMIVTGSRIPRPDFQFSNPVVSIDAKSIEYSGITDVTQLMQRIPALVNSQDSNDSAGSNAFIGGTGLNLLNLRNLGIDRTLVLVNGRRHIPGLPGSSAVDTNAIPIDLIKNVEVLTGGASAIYGADGVSGVVNFIMKDKFEGLRLRTQFGTTDAGGGDNEFASLTGGTNFANDLGNIALAVEYSHDARITPQDRSYTANETRFVRPPPGTPYDGVYDRAPMSDLRWYGSGTGGAIDVDGDFEPDYDGNTGGPWDFGTVPTPGINGETYQQGGSATPTSGYSGDLMPDIKRFDVNLFGHYDITPHIRAFTEMKFVDTRSLSYAQPTFDYFNVIPPDNYYLDTKYPGIAAAAVGNGFSGFGVPGVVDGSVLYTRDNFDFGVRGEKIKRQTMRAVWGFEGDLGGWGRWNASYTYSKLTADNWALNNRYNDRFAAALDAVDDGSGNPVCRSDLNPAIEGPNVAWNGWASPTSFTPGPGSGCVPIDIFGNGSPSKAAVDWIMVDSLAKSKLTEADGLAYLAGTFDPWFKLPAGSLGYSVGVEWRRDTSANNPAIEDQLGLTFGNKIAPVVGAVEVAETFGEVHIPIVRDMPFADSIYVDAAQRYSHYSTIGETSTWKINAVWAPVHDISFRYTRAEAVRAPNIGELFDPGGQTFEFIDDPCDPAFLAQGTANRAPNCAVLLAAASAPPPGTYTDPNVGLNISGTLKGNTGLQEETATTNTIGVVVQPRFIPHLTFSVDYYDIKLVNAVNTLSPQDIADQCVDLPTTANQFCNLIVRQNGGVDAGGIIDFTEQPVNVAQFTTQGYDLSLSYLLDPAEFGITQDLGTLSFRVIGNHLEELTFVNLPGADPDPDAGEVDAPKWQGNLDVLWERGPWSVDYAFNYFSRTERYATSSASAPRLTTLPQYQKLSALETHDIQVRYALNDRVAVYVGSNNFTDQQPDLGTGTAPEPVSAEGRTFYIGLTAQLPHGL